MDLVAGEQPVGVERHINLSAEKHEDFCGRYHWQTAENMALSWGESA